MTLKCPLQSVSWLMHRHACLSGPCNYFVIQNIQHFIWSFNDIRGWWWWGVSSSAATRVTLLIQFVGSC